LTHTGARPTFRDIVVHMSHMCTGDLWQTVLRADNQRQTAQRA